MIERFSRKTKSLKNETRYKTILCIVERIQVFLYFRLRKKDISEAFCIKIYAENLYYTFLFQIRIFLEAFKIKI